MARRLLGVKENKTRLGRDALLSRRRAGNRNALRRPGWGAVCLAVRQRQGATWAETRGERRTRRKGKGKRRRTAAKKRLTLRSRPRGAGWRPKSHRNALPPHTALMATVTPTWKPLPLSPKPSAYNPSPNAHNRNEDADGLLRHIELAPQRKGSCGKPLPPRPTTRWIIIIKKETGVSLEIKLQQVHSTH